MDKKLTDSEIIKALDESEVFLRNRVKDGQPIKLNECDVGILRNISQVCAKAYDEIDRLQTENKNLKVENQSLRSAANSLKMHYEEAQAKIERLQNVIFKKEDTMQMIAKEKQEYFDKLQTVKKWWVMIMREILFRGKRIDNGEWVQGDLFEVFDDGFFIHDKRCHSVKIIPETVGQYTGLTDKNGKKIFEGDILKGIGGLHRAYFDTSLACFEWAKINGNWKDSFINFADEYEVIGNIHDNPELLERDNNND